MKENSKEQGISTKDLLKKIVSRWWLIVLCMSVGGGVSYYISTVHLVPQYVANTKLYISKDVESLEGISVADIYVDDRLVNDYHQLIKTRLISSKVIEQLGFNVSHLDFVDRVGVEYIEESGFLIVTYTDPVPERAALIVDAISVELAENVKTLMGVNKVQIIDYAVEPTVPVSSDLQTNIILGMFIGAYIAAGIVILLFVKHDIIKSDKDMEDTFGVNVLGVVPMFKGENGRKMK